MTKTLTLEALLAALPPSLQIAPRIAENPINITGIANHNKKIRPGFLFVTQRGIERDGHPYIPDAVQRGAAAVIGEDPGAGEGLPVPYFVASSGREAFAHLCAAWYGYPSRSMKIVGITGTDGKTTTSNILYSIFNAAGYKTGMISTVNAVIGDRTLDTGLHVTTPDADDIQNYLAQMRDAGSTHCVLEVTSHGLAHHRVDGCSFDVAVVTNITHEHLDLHGSREAYRAAKGRLFEMAAQHVLNGDDVFSFEYLSQIPAEKKILYSAKKSDATHLAGASHLGREVRASSIEHAPDSMRFIANTGQAAFPIHTPLIGEFNISNILAAISAATLLEVPAEAMQAGIAQLQGIAGRMERIDAGQNFLAVVDFAHTPNALANCLRTLRRITRGKLIVAFGCNGERDVLKRPLMGAVAAELADVVILTAEDPRRESLSDILDQIESGINNINAINESKTNKRIAQGALRVLRVEDRGEALRAACAMTQAGDTVVACGKGHEQSMCFGTTEYPWDDRTAMREAIENRTGSRRL
jgi:UDP-N-acetylmuramoyl-L-alanyl-D-glutamate--2,6-diaminopimelate ligase